MTTPTGVPSRCPSCGATVRPGSEWCSLCYADLRVKPEPPAPAAPVRPEPGGEPSTLLGAVEAMTAALGDVGAPAEAGLPPRPPRREAKWPCLTCGEENPLADLMCSVCGAPFATESPTDVIAAKLQKRRRYIIAGSVVGGFVALVLLLTILTSGDLPEETPNVEPTIELNPDDTGVPGPAVVTEAPTADPNGFNPPDGVPTFSPPPPGLPTG